MISHDRSPIRDARAVAALIHQHFPELPAAQLRLQPHPGWGGDYDAWLVDERWLFRFPRSTTIARALAVEVCLLPKLAPRLPLPIPAFRWIARRADGSPRFVGYALIVGRPLRYDDLAALSSPALERVATQLGVFLSALHATPVELAVRCGVAPPTADPAGDWHRYRERLEAQVVPLLDESERTWVRRLCDDGEQNDGAWSPALHHGDLSTYHLLYDASRQALSGVIDFGDVGIGDPVGDFAWRDELGDPFYRLVRGRYDAGQDRSLDERLRRGMDRVPLIQIAYGRETGQPDEVVHGRRALRERMERSPR